MVKERSAMSVHNEPDDQGPEPANLKFLRILVTVLTATMIIGIAAVITLMVLRLNQTPSSWAPQVETLTLPSGVTPAAVTYIQNRTLILGDDDNLYIFEGDAQTATKTIKIE